MSEPENPFPLTKGRVLTAIGGVMVALVLFQKVKGGPAGPATQAFDMICLVVGMILGATGLYFHVKDESKKGE